MYIDNIDIDYVIERVRSEIKISSIIGEYVQLIKNGADEYEALCEFHLDRTLGSFKVSDKKNICKCFSCGEGKDGISYNAFKKHMNYVESAMELGLTINAVSPSEYERFSKIKFSDEKAKEIERKYIKKDKEKFIKDTASDKILNNVYTAFIKESSLSDEHRKYLKEKRFLSDEDIEKGGYFTFPSRIIMKSFEARLKREYGYNPIILRNVPGFCRNRVTGLFTFIKYKGLGICIKNADGLITGIQIRKDGDKVKKRYTWFSSAIIERKEKLGEKYEYATGASSRIAVAYPPKIAYKTLFITEGWFKAKCIANTFNCVAISVQGIGNWKDILEQIKAIEKRISIVSFNNIFIAYDADFAYNPQVFDQAMKMSKNLKKNLPELEQYYVIWNVDKGKGIDDLIYSGNRNILNKLEIEKIQSLYSNFINEVEKEHGDIVQNKVDKEILKEYFNKYVMTKI